MINYYYLAENEFIVNSHVFKTLKPIIVKTDLRDKVYGEIVDFEEINTTDSDDANVVYKLKYMLFATMQTLFNLTPIEIGPNEMNLMNKLSLFIDLNQAKSQQRTTSFLTGKIISHSQPMLVEWVNGLKEYIMPEHLCDSMFTLNCGYNFQAVVSRDESGTPTIIYSTRIRSLLI